MGLEPTRSTQEPKSCVSTNSYTPRKGSVYLADGCESDERMPRSSARSRRPDSRLTKNRGNPRQAWTAGLVGAAVRQVPNARNMNTTGAGDDQADAAGNADLKLLAIAMLTSAPFGVRMRVETARGPGFW